jgi:hypothetical protein
MGCLLTCPKAGAWPGSVRASGSSLLHRLGAWLLFGLREPGAAMGRERLKRGRQLEVAVPSLARTHQMTGRRAEAKAVVVGIDPHDRSATIEVMACDETVLSGACPSDYRATVAAVQHRPQRTWAIEGARASAGASPCG